MGYLLSVYLFTGPLFGMPIHGFYTTLQECDIAAHDALARFKDEHRQVTCTDLETGRLSFDDYQT